MNDRDITVHADPATQQINSKLCFDGCLEENHKKWFNSRDHAL